MKTIEERAFDYCKGIFTSYEYMKPRIASFAKACYIDGAKEQKAIDDAELAKLKKAWEKEAEINHDAEMAYKQGWHDAVDKACEWLFINTSLYVNEQGFVETFKLDEDFRKAMEEEL